MDEGGENDSSINFFQWELPLHAPIYKSMRSVEWSQLEMGVCLWIEQDSPFGWNTAGSFLIVVVGTQQPTSLPTYSIFSFLTRSSLSSFLDLLLYQYVTPPSKVERRSDSLCSCPSDRDPLPGLKLPPRQSPRKQSSPASILISIHLLSFINPRSAPTLWMDAACRQPFMIRSNL